MTLSDISIKNYVFAWMLMLGLIVFGALGFSRMGISQLPDVDFPVINVSIALEGAAPEVMESQVTDVVEDSVMGIQGIKEVSSVSRLGQTSITIEFNLDRDIDVAMQEVQSKLSQAQKNLPKEIDPPVITKTNPEDQPILRVVLTGNRPLKDLMAYTNDYLKDQITTVAGVGDVDLGGYIDPNLRIWVDADKMDRRELTVNDIIGAVGMEHQETPAGYIDTPAKREMNVRVMGEAVDVNEFSKLIIPSRGGAAIWRTLRIGDVATIEDGLNDIRRVAHSRGKIPAVGIGVMKQRGANAVATAKAVKEKLALIEKKLPAGMHVAVVNDSTRFIEDATRELTSTLILSAILTSLVCWLFLGSWTSTLNVLLAIPTSIVGAFIILYFMGFTINTFTMLGLSLAIGIVVDDAIMVLENIVRYNENGFARMKSAILGAREITSPAIAASIAILAIFVPVIFMQGIIGKFFYQFGVTMTAAVMLSLLEALTLTPMRCSQFLETERTSWLSKNMDRFLNWLRDSYRGLLRFALNYRWTVVVSALAVFCASLFVSTKLQKEFVPSQDQSQFMVRITTPIGSSLAHTKDVVEKCEDWALQNPNIDTYMASAGGGSAVNGGFLMINLKQPKDRVPLKAGGKKPTQRDLMLEARKALNRIPGMQRAVIQDPSLAGFTAKRGFPVEFTIRGPDWNKLAELSAFVMGKMKDSGKMVDVDTDYLEGMPEARVIPDRVKAAERGVSVASIADTVNAMIGGVRVGKFTKNGKRYDIRLRLLEKDRQHSRDINKIWVRNNRGEVIRLSEVVKIEERPTLQSISRRNRERAIGIFANPSPGHSQAEALAEVEKIGNGLPDGYSIVLSGSSQTFRDSFQSLLIALVLGIFVAYMVLASQFNSFLHPVTVLMALPFSVTGAFIALALAGRSLNIYSMIGIILLMGIVKKNSILLVDFTNHQRTAEGKNVHDALLAACPIRLRPILMTSVATITAALPPALGLGAGAETRIPMAIVVIGGVIFSTALTLLVVPCVYSLLSNLEGHKHDADLKQAMLELGETPGKSATEAK
ncbi:MAG: efflux RND transporter permease subunit [Elusimicrobiales bacterium]|nr:efflux RND transporter permease subunit [Elusimicrobiales bacterium]